MTEVIFFYYFKYSGHTPGCYLPKNFLKPLDFFLVSGEDGRGAPSWDFREGTPAKSRCSVPLRSVSAVNIIIYTLTWQQTYYNKAGPPTTSEKRSDFTLQLRQPMQKTLELNTTTQRTDFLIYSEWEMLHYLTGKYHQKGFIADGLKSWIRDNWTERPRTRARYKKLQENIFSTMIQSSDSQLFLWNTV